MTIHIEELRFKCIIGILDFERESPQDVIVNALIEYKFDDNSFLDYAKITQDIKNIMAEEQFFLLEDAIEQISSRLIHNYVSIKKLYLKITKPSILDDCKVSISNTYNVNS